MKENEVELTDEQIILAQTLLVHFQDKEQMFLWIESFLQITVVDEFIDEHSNASMLDVAWECYEAFKNDTCKFVPGYIWLSARDCGKTLMGSILNLILMLHFGVSIAHMAAIKDQSQKSLAYINGFMRQIAPYLKFLNYKIVSESKDKAKIQDDQENEAYIRVIVASASGGNSEHTPVVSFDELEVLSPEGLKGYKEAKNIPTRFNGYGPLIIKYSTRKYAAGIFAREIDNVKNTGEILRQWNLIDMTEKCQPTRHKPTEPKTIRYVGHNLPLTNISEQQFTDLTEKEKTTYSRIEAYAGCATCPLLAVCKTKLAHRKDTAVSGFKGSLYKDIDQVIGNFARNDADVAEAQLLCWRPSSKGLVYPRFKATHEEDGNLITLYDAYYAFFGEKYTKELTHSKLVKILVENKVTFVCGVDWGSTNAFSIVVAGKIPNGQWWIMETLAITELEFDDMKKYAIEIRDKYKPKAWYCDTSAPSFIKTFKKNKMPCPKFTKDVMGGIEAVRGQIVNSLNKRSLKVIDDPKNAIIMNMFKSHSFKLDALGEPTQDPDDVGGVADPADALRYIGQNAFEKKGKNSYTMVVDEPIEVPDPQKWVSVEIKKLSIPTEPTPKAKRLILDIDEE